MANKDKMVDSPNYDPDQRIPFPPKSKSSPFGSTNKRSPEAQPAKKPFYEEYNPDPSQPSHPAEDGTE